MIDQRTLARDLHAAGELPAAWETAFRAVDRAGFIPDRFWVEENDRDVAVNHATESDRWRRVVYSDRVMVTQFDDGTTGWPDTGFRPTSSCSMPSAVLSMLDALAVQEGDRVLEIGTGTGYNAALLAQRLGDDHVTTMEIDPVLADQARSACADSGHKPNVVCGDGAAGHPPGAPYDWIIVTAAVKLGRIPYAWVNRPSRAGRSSLR